LQRQVASHYQGLGFVTWKGVEFQAPKTSTQVNSFQYAEFLDLINAWKI
jgi:hypothetical protein